MKIVMFSIFIVICSPILFAQVSIKSLSLDLTKLGYEVEERNSTEQTYLVVRSGNVYDDTGDSCLVYVYGTNKKVSVHIFSFVEWLDVNDSNFAVSLVGYLQRNGTTHCARYLLHSIVEDSFFPVFLSTTLVDRQVSSETVASNVGCILSAQSRGSSFAPSSSGFDLGSPNLIPMSIPDIRNVAPMPKRRR